MKLKLKVSKGKLKTFLKEHYNLDLRYMKIVPLGTNCYSYILKDKKGKEYFMKVLVKREGQKIDLNELKKSLRDHLYLMLKCKLEFISYPIVTLRGEYVTEIENNPLILYKYLDGKIGDWKFSSSQLEDYGEKLARLHKCSKIIKKNTYPKDKIKLREIDSKIRSNLSKIEGKPNNKYEKKLQKLLLPKKEQIFSILKKLKRESKTLNFKSNHVLTHGDAIAENLLIHNNNVSIIDLDDLAFAPKEKDLWLYVSKYNYEPFMKGYHKVDPKAKLKKGLVYFYFKYRLMRDLNDFLNDVLLQSNSKIMRKSSLKEIKNYIIFELNRLDERIQEIKELI